jgi:hypothetical protein
MQLSGGELSLNLLNIVRPELRLELRTALYQAAQDSTNIETRELQVRIDDRLQIVKLKVRPVLRADDATRGLLLVLFEETGEATETEQGQLEEITRVVSAEPITRQLEDELVRVSTPSLYRLTIRSADRRTQSFKRRVAGDERRTAFGSGGVGDEQGRIAINQRGIADR